MTRRQLQEALGKTNRHPGRDAQRPRQNRRMGGTAADIRDETDNLFLLSLLEQFGLQILCKSEEVNSRKWLFQRASGAKAGKSGAEFTKCSLP